MSRNLTLSTLRHIATAIVFLSALATPLASGANKVVVVPLVDNQLPAIRLSDIVELRAPVGRTIVPANLFRINPNGNSTGAYVVPSNKMLVITSISFFPSLSSGINSIGLIAGTLRRTWRVPNSAITQLHLSPGMLINSGLSVRARGATQNIDTVELVVRGYEVSK